MVSATKASPLRFCASPFGYARRKTRVVMAGKVGIGGNNPIRLQSMTTTDTMDAESTFRQTVSLARAGCEIVRITTPTVNDARKMGEVKERLVKEGLDVPLVADIHFSPQAAMEAAEYAEKVRINPGNFADSKRFLQREYTDAEYAEELERIEEVFGPLVLKLKRLKRALRIGSNHGSLSDRIMNRYGDSPLGMVESALEYLAVCEKHGFYDVVFSMKASNPKVMIEAYRLLVARLDAEGRDYPIHLGVTEAGGGEDGRIKSAIGIGALLADGIGDTIRVSLTEDPELEIPVARDLARPFQERPAESPLSGVEKRSYCRDAFDFSRRPTSVLDLGPVRVGGEEPVRALAGAGRGAEASTALQKLAAKSLDLLPEILSFEILSREDLGAARKAAAFRATSKLPVAIAGVFSGAEPPAPDALDLFDLAGLESPSPRAWKEFLSMASTRRKPVLVEAPDADRALDLLTPALRLGVPALVGLAAGAKDEAGMLKEYRKLAALAADAPILIRAPRREEEGSRVLGSALLIGSLLADGIGDAAALDGALDPARALELLYNVLQGAGARVVKAEFVSCPSCGRTLFDLQTTTERIRQKTGHLKGVKIAVMGCIVNGPGEMADAHFGYVGGAPGKINLYVGKDCVKKGIPSEEAVDALIALIKAHGKWADPPAVAKAV